MLVNIKRINVAENAVGRDGIEFEIRNDPSRSAPKGRFRGDIVITEEGLIWCEGKTQPANGKLITWREFITSMNRRPG